MGLERGVGQGFLWACLGPQLRAGEAQEEDRDWLLGSGEGLLGERRVCNEKGTFRSTPPTRYLGQEVLASGAFRPSWSVEPRAPFLPPWEVCHPLPYLLPGLCWVQALTREPGALGHPPGGSEWARAALWSSVSSLQLWPVMEEIPVTSPQPTHPPLSSGYSSACARPLSMTLAPSLDKPPT